MITHWLLRFFCLVSTAVLTACSTTAMLMPVEGPMSQRVPVPVIEAKADGILGNSGNLTFVMPDGEGCRGRWASAAGSGLSFVSGSLMNQYGTTYLQGYSISPGTGQNPGQALLTCDRGRTFQIEFITGAGTANGFGIGKDNEGNVYRMVF